MAGLLWIAARLNMNLVSRKYRAAFLHIPKNGGTTITKILRGEGDFTHSISFDRHWNINNTSFDKIRNAGYYIFTFVRNPYTRFLSGWKAMKLASISARHNPYDGLQPKNNDVVLSKEEFQKNYKLLLERSNINIDKDKRLFDYNFNFSQTHIIKLHLNSIKNVTKIHRFENFNYETEEILTKFGIIINDIKVENKSQPVSPDEWINQEVATYIEDKYEDRKSVV